MVSCLQWAFGLPAAMVFSFALPDASDFGNWRCQYSDDIFKSYLNCLQYGFVLLIVISLNNSVPLWYVRHGRDMNYKVPVILSHTWSLMPDYVKVGLKLYGSYRN